MSINVRVYIEDTDAGGIVYYVNYLKFMERARTEWLRNLGIEHYLSGPDAVFFVVRRAEVDYRQPARLDDLLQVSAEITKIGRASLVFRQRITRQDVMLADGLIEVACVDKESLKPRALPSKLCLLLNTPQEK
ncbi:MAG: tol-pal system-associated acyl-CoA thioesterase [Moraxellaceae bacterium]|nr:tol-pal system-associated acyl-CoA thioesterase [Moraxellaceae bacterium]MDP1776237.1 tol-pal system-associated acyl-CoA thioesterase [Moraxellaceae bacterium]MDZ4299199.1 tol-pal system-associated acyl-CoA thioesterase [Moraxellaceae bacterium]MDZ4387091.1 tol-pal system-associated acyl-CoA thioesterase [Moraxellaceae bacterium]